MNEGQNEVDASEHRVDVDGNGSRNGKDELIDSRLLRRDRRRRRDRGKTEIDPSFPLIPFLFLLKLNPRLLHF